MGIQWFANTTRMMKSILFAALVAAAYADAEPTADADADAYYGYYGLGYRAATDTDIPTDTAVTTDTTLARGPLMLSPPLMLMLTMVDTTDIPPMPTDMPAELMPILPTPLVDTEPTWGNLPKPNQRLISNNEIKSSREGVKKN